MPQWIDELAYRLNALDCRQVLLKLGFLPQPDPEHGEVFLRPHPYRRATEVRGIRVYLDPENPSRTLWKDLDHTDDDGAPLWGRPTWLVAYVDQLEHDTGVLRLSELMDLDPLADDADPERTKLDVIADRALKNALGAPAKRTLLLAWLEVRGVPEATAMRAVEAGTLGLNDYRNPRVAPGEAWHGGDSLAALVRHPGSNDLLAVDLTYLDPTQTGGQPGLTHGPRDGALWCGDWRRLASAKRVVVVMSPLDALAVDGLNLAFTATVALRSPWTARSADWRLMRGKQVVLALAPGKVAESGPNKGYSPGLRATWDAHEALLALDVPAQAVDMEDWNDDDGEPLAGVSAAVVAWGASRTAVALRKIEPWLIPGMPGENHDGRPRLWLPYHDSLVYWRFRVQDDFTSWVEKATENEAEEGEDKKKKKSLTLQNVAGFRVAGISRVSIASPQSTMTGDPDLAPHEIYSVSVQVPRKSNRLLRRVVSDEQLHNVEVWKKLGPVFAPQNFLRMVNILERAANIGARDAVNFVGLAWRDGQTVVNEGPDCFFTDPQQQCPYWNLTFPSGPRESARKVVQAFQSTFRGNGVAQMLTWALGAHLKAFLGFWPHFVMQADKGVGKDTVLNRLMRTVGMTVFSRQSMQTEFRILTSISYTSHPVGWGELSANKQDLINKAVHNLQECYQYTHTRRGAELKDFLLCAPVMLAGEDVPVQTLQGKVVRNQLTKAQRGALMPDDLPVFPVREWLQFLAATPKARVLELHKECVAEMARVSSGKADDAGAARMLTNYGAVRLAWVLLCDFAGIAVEQGGFMTDLVAQMNGHILESNGDRQPWVWIVGKLLSEIARGTFRYPYQYTEHEGEAVLAVRTSHVMDHISSEASLREFWDSLPIKSDRVLKAQLIQADVVLSDSIERTIHGKRVSWMTGLSLKALENYGLYATPAVENEPTYGDPAARPPSAGSKAYSAATKGA